MEFIKKPHNKIFIKDILTNFAFWIIIFTNLLFITIPIIIFNIIFIKIKSVFTPGKEWLEMSAIMIIILIIYLIDLEINKISNKINQVIKKNKEDEDRIQELELLLQKYEKKI